MYFSALKGIAIFILCAVMFGAPLAVLAVSGILASSTPILSAPMPEPRVQARSATLIDVETGETLFEKSVGPTRPPNAFTLFMTALLAAEALRPDDMLTMDREVYGITGHQVGFLEREEVPVGDLLHATLFNAGDDAAVALAKGVSGSVDDFVDLMNERARSLGCAWTVFENVNGRLPAPGQKTTASDLARILQAALKNDMIRSYASKSEYTIPATNMSAERELENASPLVFYDADAGRQFVVPAGVGEGTDDDEGAAELAVFGSKDGRGVIAVVFGDDGGADTGVGMDIIAGMYTDAVALLEYGFAMLAEEEADEPEEEPEEAILEEEPERRSFLEAIGLGDFREEGFSFYLRIGAAVIIVLVIVLLIVLIRHRYTRDPYVRSVRSGRATHEVKRVRKLK